MKDSLKKQIKERLVLVYKSEEKAEAATKLIDEQLNGYETTEALETPLSEKDSILITYGDTITDGEKPGLEVLHQFLNKYVGEAIETVHLLPMYPYTSDDGFSVVDYRKINPELGDWEQIKEMSSDYGLMFDAVINHISKSSEWFEGYLKGEEPYKNYFITCDKDADYSTVTRPRALPLLTKFQTKDGEKYVWTTFSDDQIDLNFECPELLAEILDILVMYGRSGAKFIRLDAIGFMWKELGTTCMHLPETHELIKLMKEVLKVYAPGTRIITETNVPHKDNISYFGENGDEADLAALSMPGSTEVADVNDAFVGKHAPMAMYSTYILGNVKEAGFAEDLTLVLPNRKSEAAYGCITVLGIAAGMDEAKTDAAKKFVSFMLEDENNVDWLNMAPGGIQPVIKTKFGPVLKNIM